MLRFFACLALVALTLPGCVAKTAATIVTAPVRIASGAVDLATTSQSEADEKRGRELRKRQERLRELEAERAKQHKRCERGDGRACDKVTAIDRQMEDLRATFLPPH